MNTVHGLQMNTLGDGFFHTVTWLSVWLGLYILYSRVTPAARCGDRACCGRGCFAAGVGSQAGESEDKGEHEGQTTLRTSLLKAPCILLFIIDYSISAPLTREAAGPFSILTQQKAVRGYNLATQGTSKPLLMNSAGAFLWIAQRILRAGLLYQSINFPQAWVRFSTRPWTPQWPNWPFRLGKLC